MSKPHSAHLLGMLALRALTEVSLIKTRVTGFFVSPPLIRGDVLGS